MGALFGKQNKPVTRITPEDKAILQLKQQRDKLKRYQKRLEGNLEKDVLIAKKLLSDGKREKAKLVLRKKRFQEQILQNTESQLEKLDQLTHDIEFAQIEVQVLNGLRVGNNALKKIHDLYNVDEVEMILEETQEGIEKQLEIADLISGELTEEDDEVVEAELEALLNVENELPDVPSDELSETTEEEVVEKEKKAKASPGKIAVEA